LVCAVAGVASANSASETARKERTFMNQVPQGAKNEPSN
jgi:hypothetical protein